jgi:hypothetical protein
MVANVKVYITRGESGLGEEWESNDFVNEYTEDKEQ